VSDHIPDVTKMVVEAERDRLIAENSRLRAAAELGLEYAESELADRKRTFDGYPSKWELDEQYVKQIKAALNCSIISNSSTEAQP